MFTKSSPANNNNFFQPINELDPLIRKPGDKVEYKFNCELFVMDDPGSADAYKNIISGCLNGEYVQGIKLTNFDKEGGMCIYLEWMEIIDKTEEVEDSEESKDSEKNKSPKKEKKAEEPEEQTHFSTEPTLALDLTDSATTEGLDELTKMEE